MKRDLLTSILALVLLASSLAAAAKCYQFLNMSHDYRALQEIVAQVNQRRNLMGSFLVDLNEYAMRNPAFNPMLDQMSLRLRPVTNNVPVKR